MTRYTAIMMSDPEGWAFLIPDLPGFTAQFDSEECPTLASAISAAERVLADFTGALIDAGEPLPTPSDIFAVARERILERGRNDGFESFVMLTARPIAGEQKRVNISMDSATLAFIDREAERLGLTRSAFLAEAARAYA